VVLQKVIALLAIVSSAACSATRQIAQSANQVSASSVKIARQADYIAATSDQPEVVKAAIAIHSESDIILEHSQMIAENVAAVKDIVPWMTLVEWLAIAAAGICAAWILTASGALGAVRAALGWLPRRKVMDATLARSVMDDSNPASIREYIAARRMSDAEFNAAFVASGKSVDSALPTSPSQQPR
jgi:transcriptional regulator GlxA family with amidase domain